MLSVVYKSASRKLVKPMGLNVLSPRVHPRTAPQQTAARVCGPAGCGRNRAGDGLVAASQLSTWLCQENTHKKR